MLSDEKVIAALKPFETVEWKYDGLNGTVIKWTKEHGNTNDDPIELAWILDANEKVLATPSHADINSVSMLVKFLNKAAKEHGGKRGGKKSGERKKMLVKWTDAKIEINGDIPGVKAAIEVGQPILGYVYIPEADKDDKKWKPYYEKGLKFEGGMLADKDLARLSEECVRIRFDYTDDGIQKFLKGAWGLKGSPLVFLLDTTKEKAKPRIWRNSTTPANNVVRDLKKVLGKDD